MGVLRRGYQKMKRYLITLVFALLASSPALGAVCGGSPGDKCPRCITSSDCHDGKFCCPWMKKCVATSTEPCSTVPPAAKCNPPCHDDCSKSQCNADFPDNWC